MNGYKVVLLGTVFVGKSSITHKFIYDNFNPITESTVGASFFKKKLMVDNKEICLNIWDSSGASRFQSLLPMYIKGAKVVLLVYDITNYESFIKIDNILNDINSYNDDIVIVLVGNKSDLPNRMVIYEEAKSYALENDLLFYEVSACTGEYIAEMFHAIAEIMSAKNIPKNNTIILTNTTKDKKCCY